MYKYLDLALSEARKCREKYPFIAYTLGAVAVRKDGTVVSSHNLPATNHMPCAHAEARVLRKAGRDATLLVVRLSTMYGVRMAKPCPYCEALLRSKHVKECWYTTDTGELELLFRD